MCVRSAVPVKAERLQGYNYLEAFQIVSLHTEA